jgi:hypothetical protein
VSGHWSLVAGFWFLVVRCAKRISRYGFIRFRISLVIKIVLVLVLVLVLEAVLRRPNEFLLFDYEDEVDFNKTE